MKKLLYSLLAFAVVFASCEKTPEIPEDDPGTDPGKEKPDVKPEDKTVTKEFTASFEAFAGGTQQSWAAGDKILLFDGTSVQTLTNSAEAGVIAKFSATVDKDAKAFLAYYPAGDGVTLSGTSVTLNLPADQAPAAALKMPFVAKASGAVLSFRPFMATLVYSFGREDITKVEFQTSGGEKVAGSATVDYSGENPSVAAASDKITVSGRFEAEKEYYLSVPAQDYSGYSVKVYAGNELVDELSADAGKLEPGMMITVPTLAIPPEPEMVFQITAVKVWGGTGPDYGGTKVINLYEHPEYFVDTDGRGINAWKDNYLVVKGDGTCINYAGEDGRNWWFVYSKDVNPQTRKDLDLKDFYDVLPRAEGSYTYEENESGVTFTFDKGNGASSTANLATAGTYDLPDGKTVTVDEVALMFVISGGKDNWDYIYKDYDVIACRPRAIIIELHQMEEGFVVPDQARTTDADFEFVPEDDPENPQLDFNLQDLLGSWNVYGTNSAKDAMPKFGLYVLGGSGDDPAFVSPIDKSWDWDDTIWKESDNGLVIKATGQEGNVISGTMNWWAGNDGAFWNYKWKDGTDLSMYYDAIPKGEKAFTLDASTLTVTLSNGKQPKLLVPGSHEFVYGKTLTIPEGCFALDFHIMDPIDATADRWSDKDRFINAPLEYVIIFEKVE